MFFYPIFPYSIIINVQLQTDQSSHNQFDNRNIEQLWLDDTRSYQMWFLLLTMSLISVNSYENTLKTCDYLYFQQIFIRVYIFWLFFKKKLIIIIFHSTHLICISALLLESKNNSTAQTHVMTFNAFQDVNVAAINLRRRPHICVNHSIELSSVFCTHFNWLSIKEKTTCVPSHLQISMWHSRFSCFIWIQFIGCQPGYYWFVEISFDLLPIKFTWTFCLQLSSIKFTYVTSLFHSRPLSSCCLVLQNWFQTSLGVDLDQCSLLDTDKSSQTQNR